MEYNFNQPLTDLDNKVITQPVFDGVAKVSCPCGNIVQSPKQTDTENVTLGIMCRSILLNPSQEDLKLPGEIHQERTYLAMRIKEGEREKKEVEIDSTEVGTLSELVKNNLRHIPLILTRCLEILDQKNKDEKNEQ